MMRAAITSWTVLMSMCLGQVGSAPAMGSPEKLRVSVIRSFPHDPGAYTQGLLFQAGKIYESTGLVGQSSVRRVVLQSGSVEMKVPLEEPLFGEGLAYVNGRLYQLTWKDGRAIVWNAASFKRERELRYQGEGWGLCFDGTQLIMSDGTDRLVRRNPQTFEVTGELRVRSAGVPVNMLNELECVGSTIYANVWQTPYIVRIDARNGGVTAWIDATGLLSPEEARRAEVLNGIAYMPESSTFIITGKLWPRMFEVKFVPAAG